MVTSTYILDQSWRRERDRLERLSAMHDPITIRHLEGLGVGEGWRCAEVGAGAGSIARWLAARVGPTGEVVATDVDTRFLDGPNDPALRVQQHDIVAEPLEERSYDLVHTRFLLMHLRERERALRHILDALRPGGWLLLEEGDFPSYQRSYPPSEVLRSTGAAVVRLLVASGADPEYGPKLYPALAAAGLINLGIEAQQIIVPCGTELIPAFTLLLAQLKDKLVAGGLVTDGAVTAAIDELEAPSSTAVYGPILVSVWGQRPHG